ncbi:PaaI family thioesterase [Corynebacterium sp. H113]|uniref:PaaI family thioesterase n=1 Tax=Corynebacterium sp. H113 TaxID=3133419 RepID=UPI00309BA8E6
MKNNDTTPQANESSTDRSAALREYVSMLRMAAQSPLTSEQIASLNDSMAIREIAGLDATIGTSYRELGPNHLVMEMTVDERHLQPWGLANGGMFATLGESAGSVAGFIAVGGKQPVVGVNNSTDFYRSAQAGDVVVSTATPVHLGRTSQVWEIRHTRDSDGKLLSRTNLRLAILPAEAK